MRTAEALPPVSAEQFEDDVAQIEALYQFARRERRRAEARARWQNIAQVVGMAAVNMAIAALAWRAFGPSIQIR